MKKQLFSAIFCISTLVASAQSSGYNIKIHLKNYKDSLVYLTYYQFDKTLIKDTYSKIQKGTIVFKGNDKLNTGIYAVVSQDKKILFNFFVDDDTQNLEFKSEVESDFSEGVVAINDTRQNDFLYYLKYLGTQSSAFQNLQENANLRTKSDTLAFLEQQKEIEKNSAEYEENFITQNKGTYIASVLNLKREKTLKEVPLALNGRPDSIAVFNYYKQHYWDGVDFKDDAVMRNPFFYNKFKNYFDQLVALHPDSVCVEIDKILDQTSVQSLLYKSMLANFAYSYETSTIMGFDKVFVYLADNYFKTGKAAGLYDDETVVQKVITLAEKLRPLLIGAPAQDLFMIKAQEFSKMKALGFEDAENSTDMTELYYKHLNEITKMYVKLSDVIADYTILVFWDPDCSHCQIEIPILLKEYNDMIKRNVNVKVYSVNMQYEGEKFLKYIADHQLPWINVYDGARFNNAFQKYDVNSTPIIYILDRNKVIKAKRIGASQVNDFITSLEMEN